MSETKVKPVFKELYKGDVKYENRKKNRRIKVGGRIWRL